MTQLPSGLMHGDDVRLTIYADNSTRPIQVWGPVTSQTFDDATGKVTDLRVSGAKVFDGRLAELVNQVRESQPPADTDDESYVAGATRVLDMIGVLQPVDRAPVPAEQADTSDRFARPDVDSALASMTAEMKLHLGRYDELMAQADGSTTGLGPQVSIEAATHYAAGMALSMAIDVINGIPPRRGTYQALRAA